MRAATKLRLATKLEDLEDSQEIRHQSRQQTQGKVPDPAVSQAGKLPRLHSHVAQRKYSLDASSPAWKQFVFWYVYIPLFRFFHKRLGFITPDRIDADGSYSWLEHQGCFVSEREARADAKRYKFGFVVPDLPLGRSLPSDTAEELTPYFPDKKETIKSGLAPLIAEARSEVKLIRETVEAAQHKQ